MLRKYLRPYVCKCLYSEFYFRIFCCCILPPHQVPVLCALFDMEVTRQCCETEWHYRTYPPPLASLPLPPPHNDQTDWNSPILPSPPRGSRVCQWRCAFRNRPGNRVCRKKRSDSETGEDSVNLLKRCHRTCREPNSAAMPWMASSLTYLIMYRTK